MSSLRGEGQDGITVDPIPTSTLPGDSIINSSSNTRNKNSAMDPVAPIDRAEASGSAAPAPPTLSSDERPLPPTPTADEPESNPGNPGEPGEPVNQEQSAAPAKLLSLPFRPRQGSSAEGSSSAPAPASSPAAAPASASTSALEPEPITAPAPPPPAPAPAPAPASVAALESVSERAPTPHPAAASSAVVATPQEPVHREVAARAQYQAPLPPIPPASPASPASPTSPASPAQPQPAQPQTQQPRRLSQREYVVPRWQPDAEVLYCPICFVYFSLFTRKHHCRKCGRVVCNNCSPHRITIPHAFIVQPPELQQAREQAGIGSRVAARVAAASSSSTMPAAGAAGVPVGGERVRLCNPCVPDPNTNPPSSSAAPGPHQHRHSTHFRSRSGSSISGGNANSSHHGAADSESAGASSSRSRRHGLSFFSSSHHGSGGGGSSSSSGNIVPGDRRYTVSNAQNPSGTGPQSSLSSRNPYYGSLPPQNTRYHHRMSQSSQPEPGNSSTNTMPSGSASAQRQPRYQIPEEDECPVCHLELPRRTLPDFELRREQHIEDCIALHSQYMMGNTTAGARTRAASSAAPASTSPLPTTGARPTQTPSPARPRYNSNSSNNDDDSPSSSLGSQGSSDEGSSASASASASAAYSPSSPRAMAVHRHTAMFPYKATEKDCAADAECTICLEDLEVGVAMARLECFCRFHEKCIRAWFVRHPGRCPVHQHGMAD